MGPGTGGVAAGADMTPSSHYVRAGPSRNRKRGCGSDLRANGSVETAETTRRRAALAMVAVCVALLGACSSSQGSPTTTPSTSTTAAAATPSAQRYLLRVMDLPPGWTLDNTPRTMSDSCYDDPLTRVPSTSYSHVNFTRSGGLPQLAQELSVFTSSQSAASGFSTVKGTLDGCKSFTETLNTETISGTLGPAPSPVYGNRSTAYDATLTVEGQTINQGFVMIQKGRIVTIVALGNQGAADPTTLYGFVNRAVGRLPS
jgi:hypothetical protein